MVAISGYSVVMWWSVFATVVAAAVSLASAVFLLALVAQWDPYSPLGRRAPVAARAVLATLTLGFIGAVVCIWTVAGGWGLLFVLILPAILAPVVALGLRDRRDS